MVVYLLFMLWIGVRLSRRTKDRESLYTANHSLGSGVLPATVCATIIGGSSMMGRTGLGYTSGIECLMTALPYMLGMFLFFAYAGRIHDVGQALHVDSIPALFSYRFGKASKLIIAVIVALAMLGTVASQVTATATIINVLGDDIGISYELGALIATIVFVLYTGASGLFGVVYTDVVQFFNAGDICL